ncbi:MAG: diacylglycerol/lipid kinase family protein [Flavobacteriales bacterium]
MNNRWLFIVNPASADGNGGAKWSAVHRTMMGAGFDPVVWSSEYNGHIEELIEHACHKGFRKIASYGGDGSLNAVVNGLMSQQVCKPEEVLLAHYPSGTGNDWTRFFKVPNNPKQWVEMINKNVVFKHDLGIIDLFKKGKSAKHYFVNIAGVAYESKCAVLITEARKSASLFQGKLFYDFIVLKGLFSFKSPELVFKYDGITRKERMFNMCIAICGYNGGGMIPAPYANPSDGVFDITTFEDMSKLTVLKDYTKLRKGTILKNPKINAFRTEKIEIERTDKPDYIEADGEFVGMGPATFTSQKQALRFVIGEVPEEKVFPF